MLPREELYMPPMNIRVKDHRQFGRKPMVGIHVLKNFEVFQHKAVKDKPAAVLEQHGSSPLVAMIDISTKKLSTLSQPSRGSNYGGISGGEEAVMGPYFFVVISMYFYKFV